MTRRRRGLSSCALLAAFFLAPPPLAAEEAAPADAAWARFLDLFVTRNPDRSDFDSGDLKNRIPDDLARRYLGASEEASLSSVEILARTPRFVAVVFAERVMAGPGAREYHVATLDASAGGPIAALSLGSAWDGAGGFSRITYRLRDEARILEVEVSEGDDGPAGDGHVAHRTTQHRLFQSGHLAPLPPRGRVDWKAARRHPQMSAALQDDKALRRLPRAQLAIARNEIFAHHGYLFTTDKMMAIFVTQGWYEAEHTDVTHLLTEVERQNIANIKALEH